MNYLLLAGLSGCPANFSLKFFNCLLGDQWLVLLECAQHKTNLSEFDGI